MILIRNLNYYFYANLLLLLLWEFFFFFEKSRSNSGQLTTFCPQFSRFGPGSTYIHDGPHKYESPLLTELNPQPSICLIFSGWNPDRSLFLSQTSAHVYLTLPLPTWHLTGFKIRTSSPHYKYPRYRTSQTKLESKIKKPRIVIVLPPPRTLRCEESRKNFRSPSFVSRFESLEPSNLLRFIWLNAVLTWICL